MNLALLDNAIKAVAPIEGVSIGRRNDKSTWRITFKPEATEQQMADAQAALLAFDTVAFDAEEARKAGVDAAIGADATIAQLKAMTAAEFDTWWAANVTNAAQAINVLKRVTRVVIRRLL